MTTALKPASPKQMAFAATLLKERDWSHFGEDTLSDALSVQAGQEIPSRYASELISALLAAPRKAKPAAAPASNAVTEPGLYVAPNGDVVKVQRTKDGQRMYAKVMVDITGTRLNFHGDIVKFDYVYAPGLLAHMTASMKMTKEQAEDFGLRTGRCCWCKKELKVASSVLAGMGPVCAKKIG